LPTLAAAQALGCQPQDIDGIDISVEMLRKAKAKGLFRSTFQVDLTASLDAIKNNYGAVLSAGTFTSGHLGPEPLIALLDIARPGGLFVIGVNKVFFAKAGFDAMVKGMQARELISDLSAIDVRMYDRVGHDHSADKAYVLCYRKT
jgi:hypothetical protein